MHNSSATITKKTHPPQGLDCIECRVQPIRDHHQIFIVCEIVKSGPVPKTTSKIPSDS